MISVANAKILKTDVGGLPVGWIGFEDAAKHVATGEVAWSLGSVAVLRGGTSRSTSKRSVIEIPSIIAVHGEHGHRLLEREPIVAREKILRRDRNLCAFCGEVLFREEAACTASNVRRKIGAQVGANYIDGAGYINGAISSSYSSVTGNDLDASALS